MATATHGAPAIRGATSLQINEATRWAARYGRSRAVVRDGGVLELYVFGYSTMPWVLLELGRDGRPVRCRELNMDPREQGLPPAQRRALLELRATPNDWRTVESVALELRVNRSWARELLRALVERGLADTRDAGAGLEYRNRELL